MGSKRGRDRLLTQKELAEVLPITTRQIRRLLDDGLPTETLGGRIMYPQRACVRWYIEYREQLVAGQEEVRDARQRKLQADARMAELEVEEREGQLITLAIMEETMTTIVERLQTRITALKGSLPVRVVGLDNPRAAKKVTDEALNELLDELRTAADTDADGRHVA